MDTQNDRPIGNFYEVSKGAIWKVAEHSQRHQLVLAYLALKRGQQVGNCELVSAGSGAIKNTLGISRPRAEKLMDDLREIAWGGSIEETALVDAYAWNQAIEAGELDGKQVHHGRWLGKNKKGTNKVMPSYGDDFIYLPNNLNTKHAGNRLSPLGQLYAIRDKQLGLDATMLLLGLYEHLDLQTYGGADPTKTMYIPWRTEGLGLGYMGQDSDGLHYWLIDMRANDDSEWWKAHTTTSNWAFVTSITSETQETGADRFWAAWHELESLGLMYQMAMVFDTDPSTDPDAEALYPLWMFNQSERNKHQRANLHSGGLAHQTSQKALRANGVNTEELEAILSEVTSRDGYGLDEPTGFFVMAADTPTSCTVGVIRPRFTPQTNDGFDGENAIEEKASEWVRMLL